METVDELPPTHTQSIVEIDYCIQISFRIYPDYIAGGVMNIDVNKTLEWGGAILSIG